MLPYKQALRPGRPTWHSMALSASSQGGLPILFALPHWLYGSFPCPYKDFLSIPSLQGSDYMTTEYSWVILAQFKNNKPHNLTTCQCSQSVIHRSTWLIDHLALIAIKWMWFPKDNYRGVGHSLWECPPRGNYFHKNFGTDDYTIDNYDHGIYHRSCSVSNEDWSHLYEPHRYYS